MEKTYKDVSEAVQILLKEADEHVAEKYTFYTHDARATLVAAYMSSYVQIVANSININGANKVVNALEEMTTMMEDEDDDFDTVGGTQ